MYTNYDVDFSDLGSIGEVLDAANIICLDTKWEDCVAGNCVFDVPWTEDCRHCVSGF